MAKPINGPTGFETTVEEMTKKIETDELTASPLQSGGMPEYKSLEHGSTVIVAENDSELFYILKWCERIGKDVGGWMYNNDGYPFCISVHGKIVGWTDKLDRALYYKPFSEFLADIEA